MKFTVRHWSIARHALFALTVLLFGAPARAADSTELRVVGGNVKFTVATNILAVSIHGESKAISAGFTLYRAGGQIQLENVRATVAPESLTTGLSLRDNHMRKKIFSLDDGTMPPLEFASDRALCPEPAAGQESVCTVPGELILRGVRRPFTFSLKVRNEGKTYRVTADSLVLLSAFGIERPCQLGVCVSDEVKLKLEFRTNESPALQAGAIR
jgi:polyisoprenoid-binding protein YceI